MDKLKHMLELYEPHPFWDTQPVPKDYSLGAVPVSLLLTSVILGERRRN